MTLSNYFVTLNGKLCFISYFGDIVEVQGIIRLPLSGDLNLAATWEDV